MATPADAADLPLLRLDLDAVDTNLGAMAAWCARHRVSLAPHVKTSMSRPLVDLQMASGAVGVTVATVRQAATVRDWGHKQILIANEVVDERGLHAIRTWLERDSELRVRCLVDSHPGLDVARRVFASSSRPLDVLIDVGAVGGRAGVRDAPAARRLAERVHAVRGLALVGVAGYEGVRTMDRDRATLALVDEHCRLIRSVFLANADLYETDYPVFSAGGSAFPDRVVAHLPGDQVPGTEILLRSGCYVTHDHGAYANVGPIHGLTPALTVRAITLSTPESGIAVVGAGRRELPHDAGMPVLLRINGEPVPTGPAPVVSVLYDHHSVLTSADVLAVGDVVELGISHPCSAFSRWSHYLVTRGDDVLGIWRTEF